ncbi:uncharacterized protein LOC122460574 [Dermochelys coriacea]|uniref:uncharacterized protein LOC122460574 n=1 Tax=Dermochelys coriacea TaxID=27794 RepID=UPI001CA8FD59|nr:uncharacterized protein LOC122460574 [Dermochelys coriacea]
MALRMVGATGAGRRFSGPQPNLQICCLLEGVWDGAPHAGDCLRLLGVLVFEQAVVLEVERLSKRGWMEAGVFAAVGNNQIVPYTWPYGGRKRKGKLTTMRGKQAGAAAPASMDGDSGAGPPPRKVGCPTSARGDSEPGHVALAITSMGLVVFSEVSSVAGQTEESRGSPEMRAGVAVMEGKMTTLPYILEAATMDMGPITLASAHI